MKIRTQLVLAFLLLAVVPLTAIVLYSYFTQIRAVEQAVEAEAEVLTAEMDDRMRGIKTVLVRRIEGLRDLPFGRWLGEGEQGEMGQAFVGRLVTEIGDAAPYLEGLTFIPETAPRPPAPPLPGEAPPAPGADPEVEPLEIDVRRLIELGRDAGDDPVAGEEFGREIAELAIAGVREAFRTIAAPETPETDEAAAELQRRAERLERQAERVEVQAEELARRAEVLALRQEERHRLAEARRIETQRLLGAPLDVEVREEGEVVGELQAQVDAGKVLRSVLRAQPRRRGEIPFAIDADGKLYPADEDDRPILEELALERDPVTGEVEVRHGAEEWVVVSKRDPDSDLVFGVARPIGESLADIRRTTLHNLGIGLGLIALAFLGVLPLSRHISRGLETVTEGARRIAHGDLSARVPVESTNEVGQLARAFNHMAEEVQTHQKRLLEEEVERRLLGAEYERKSRELEEAREFQLSLLPKTLPAHPAFDVAVDMRTAAEVGGDYYDYHLTDDGALTVAIGDATGHGARAGTMVTVVKSLFTSNAGTPPGELLGRAAAAIKRMDLGRMAMALTVVRFEEDALTLAAAAMPPVLVYRAGRGDVEELVLPGMPLGGLDSEYDEERLDLRRGDVVLLLSDGLPELPDPDGKPFGYARVRGVFAAAAASKDPEGIVADLNAAASRWTDGGPPTDDMTFVVVKKK